ncbi:MAG: hypothetical protein ABJA79_00710 [Parafilimonas sp.]
MAEYKVVYQNGKPLKTNITLHPGKVLGEELEAREISRKILQKKLECNPRI